MGARRYPWRYRGGEDYIVLADPDDNLFCVVQIQSGPTEEIGVHGIT